MTGVHTSARVALAVSLLALLVLSAGATAAGYLIEAHNQRVDRADRVGEAASYVEHGTTHAETGPWQRTLTRKLTRLGLDAQLTIVSPASRRTFYASSGLVPNTTPGPGPRTATGVRGATSSPSAAEQPANQQPTATYLFPLAGNTLRLDLYAPSLDRSQRLLVALAAGLAALLIGGTVLMWAASRWLVVPLHRLNAQIDAIAGGDPIETPAASPILEIENIAEAIAGMGATLAQTADEDARIDTERRLLVSSIAHDLRTPLFSLRGYLDAIATGIGDPGERLERARAKAQQIDRLVTSLFDYTRADFDKRPNLQTTDFADAVTDATAAFEHAADKRGVTLRVTVLTSTPVHLDRDAFERALANVIDNALHHTPRGGAIEVTCGEDPAGAFVRVVDDGPGIPSDLLSHVFEPMVRANGSGNRRTSGAGLGLSIAARLLRNQNGSIDAGNAPERGAILTLRLPRAVA